MTMIAELPAGFADEVLSAQSTFRSVMEAMARPGTVQRVTASVGTPFPVVRGTAAIALTLFDHDTPIWLDPKMSGMTEVAKWLKFHSGAPVVEDCSIASFALIGDGSALPDLSRFALGTNEYPDRSTTLILQVDSLTEGPAFQLAGPGIDGTIAIRVTVQPKDLFERLALNETLFPRGVDVVLVSEEAIAAIPRTTRLSAKGG
ncbi:MAG: phosphonate C-P lyase system protein PhnH [Bradyrhizobium sp.]|nr:phosphonate C-P lyase system protein PhnH [Bradyrhizobium sp.]